MAQLTEKEAKRIADIQDRINNGVKIQQKTQDDLDKLLLKQRKYLEENLKVNKAYAKTTSDAQKAEENLNKSISSRIQNLMKGNVASAIGLGKVKEHEQKQADLTKQVQTNAEEVIKLGFKQQSQRLGVLNLNQDISDGLVEEGDLTDRIKNLNIEDKGIKEQVTSQATKLLTQQQGVVIAGADAAGQMKLFNKLSVGAGIIFTALFAIASKFAGSIDAIGKQFGSLNVLGDGFKQELLTSQEAVIGIGASLEDVIATTNELSSEFGLSIDEAADLSAQVIDTARAVGLSNEEAAKLSGILQTTSGLSGEQAERLTEGAFQLAGMNRVNPSAVLKDMASSSEAFAMFSEDGGDNLAKAAVQARALGLSLDTTSKIAEGLLDFENSINKEVEASVLIGKQLNFQKARELALDNDIEGAMSNIVSQLGSEAEFNKLNVIQRKALADSIGVSVADMAKMVANQDKSNILAGETAKSFADIIGKDAMSELTATMNELKIFGVAIANTIGPPLMLIAKALNFALVPIGNLISGISQGARGLNPMESVLSTTGPTGTSSTFSGGGGSVGGGGNMNINVSTGGISGRDIPLLAEVEFDGSGTESLSARG